MLFCKQKQYNNQKYLLTYTERKQRKQTNSIHALFICYFLRGNTIKSTKKTFIAHFTITHTKHMQHLFVLGTHQIWTWSTKKLVEQWSSKCVVSVRFGIGRPYCRMPYMLKNSQKGNLYLIFCVQWILMLETLTDQWRYSIQTSACDRPFPK